MREKRPSRDWFVVFVAIALFLIPLYLIPEMPLFKSSVVSSASNYGFVVFTALIFSFLWWVISESRNRHFPRKLLTTLGFRWSKWQAAAGFVIGFFAGTLMWHMKSGFSSVVPPIDLVANTLLGAPLVEEILFRGYLINRSLSKNTLQRRILAIAASILVFSWMHANYPEQKIVGGVTFTAAYLWGWRKNMVAAIMAHLGSNAATVFWGYSSLGITVTIWTVGIIGAIVSLVVLILWCVYPITNILAKAFVKFLQKIPNRKR